MTTQLEALKHRFLERCSSDLIVLRRALLMPEEVTSDDFKTLVHQMSGAAAVFGLPHLSAAAMCLDDVLSAGTPPSRQQLQALIDSLSVCNRSFDLPDRRSRRQSRLEAGIAVNDVFPITSSQRL